MKIILVVEEIVLNKEDHWKLFVANKLTDLLCECDVCLLPIPALPFTKNESCLKQIHYKYEGKGTQLNKKTWPIGSEKIIASTQVNNEDLLVNLSSVQVEELGKKFKAVVWEVLYHEQPIQEFQHVGEYEIIHRLPTIDISLVKYTHDNGMKLLDVARHNPHYSAVRNFQNVVYTLHLMIAKNIRKQNTPCDFVTANKNMEFNFLSYACSFYKSVFEKILGSIVVRLNSNMYGERWTVGISKGVFLHDGIGNLVVHGELKGEFWADPFLYRNPNNNKLYLFVERFPFKEKKGVISCGEVDELLHINNMHDVLVKPYHLSYPHIIEEEGNLYMMPESSANHQLEIYQCMQFPDKWEIFSIGLKGKNLTDTVYYRDSNGERWLFATISDSEVMMYCTVMNIYHVDSLTLKEITPHRQNPIIIDSSIARNGGRIFEHDGCVYRVAQNNTYGEYGHGTSIRKITKLTLDEYEEEEVARLDGGDIPGFKFNHQLCQIDDAFVIDIRK